MKKIVKNLMLISIIQLILHGAWEYLQCGLFYTMEGQSSFEHTRLMISATIGDVGIALGVFMILAFVNQSWNWFLDSWDKKDKVIMILYALFVSFFFEVHALYINRWGYSAKMPLFPKTNIGLLPVIQLLILLPLGFVIARIIIQKYGE
ncbi:MAG: hypothetical protein ACQERJ_03410 [Bacillota bacterium]